MKKLISILTMAVLGIAMFTACSDDDSNSPDKDAKITMVTTSNEASLGFYTFKEGDIVTIDFGDGKVEEFKSVKDKYDEDCYRIDFDHTYTDGKAKHTIVIEAENVEGLDCGFKSNELTSLDVSTCTALTGLYCASNQLTSLDVSKCTALTDLECCNNELSTLNVSKNTALTALSCYNNPLTSLDVSKCTALTDLHCDDNQLTSLDVSKNTALTYLWCRENKLTSLDVSKNTALISLLCDDNKLISTELNKIFTDLPQEKEVYEYQSTIDISGNPGAETCDRSIAEKKGWKVE